MHFLLGIVLILGLGPLSSHAQPAPASVDRRVPSLVDACRGDGTQVGHWLLDATSQSHGTAMHSGPHTQAAYALFERHYQAYRDPQMASTWQGKPYVVVQPVLWIKVVADSLFARWDAQAYPLDVSWDDPPVRRYVEVRPFRPHLVGIDAAPIYATPEVHEQIVDLLLPDGLYRASEKRRRVDCLEPHLGLIDWVVTSRRAHSPPRVSVTMNERRTRALVGYGWGKKGGVWVLYRRPSAHDTWQEIEPVGAWSYNP